LEFKNTVWDGKMIRSVGVLALQGDFREHRQALERLGCTVKEVRLPHDLEGLAGIVMPGGESTTIGKLMVAYGLDTALKDFHANGGAIWGTCAGAIIMASHIVNSDQPRLALLEMSVARNAFGRQVDSFETDLIITGLEGGPFRAVFIRAPIITEVGPGVEILCRVDEQIVLVRHGRLMASSFHPELTGDDRLHRFFLEHVVEV
jgi:5'-phosphate synthase pdxT subunit